MTPTAAERLRAPGLAPLVDELARRFGEGGTPVAVTLRDAPFDTRQAIADLFGLARLPKVRFQVRIDRLLGALRLASIGDLLAVIESLRGPLPDRRAQREAHRAARDDLWSWLASEARGVPLFPGDAGADAWVDAQRAAGARGGLERHRRRLEQALAVLRALPADGVSLAVLADRCAGGPHTLDRGRSLAAVVLDAVATATGSDRPSDADGVRALWECVGVVPDQLSSTVLALSLPGDDDSPLGRWLAAAADIGEPVVLTLANLRRWPRPPLASDRRAYVFENPSLIAEAKRGGWTGPPLLCSSGRPTIAVVTLLRQVGAEGAALYQHADFDPVGISITGWLAERAGTTPWCMTSDAYREACAASPAAPPFDGAVPPTPWAPGLEQAMKAERVPVYEESLTDRLLASARPRQPDVPSPPASSFQQ